MPSFILFVNDFEMICRICGQYTTHDIALRRKCLPGPSSFVYVHPTNCIILSSPPVTAIPVHASQRNVGSAEDQRRALRRLPPGAEGPLPAPAQTAVPVGLLLSQQEE